MSSNQSHLYVVTAPSGAGKTSLVNALARAVDNLHISVSFTTRPKRPNEQNGVHYNFITQQDFEAKVEAKDLLEYANVFGYYYGTSASWVESELESGNDVILEIDWQGARQVMQRFENCVSVFVLPPSLDALKQRLIQREQDSKEVIDKRLHEAVLEMSHYHEFDYLLVNDDFDKTLNDFKSIVRAKRLTTNVRESQLAGLLNELAMSDNAKDS